jgi:hypothetical protein
MATTTQQTVDVAGAIAEVLRSVEGLRVHEVVVDTARPPCVVLGQPDLDFVDPDAGFCAATWSFPVNIITARTDAVAAQREMSQMLLDVVTALGADVPGIFMIQPLDARPQTVSVNGQELPSYLLTVRVRA